MHKENKGFWISFIMFIFLFLLVAVIAMPRVARADQIQCVDTLASAQYGKELRHIPLEYGIRGFAKKEFGDFFPVAKKELERGRRFVGVALTWRDNHTFVKQDLQFAKKEIKRYQPLCQQYKGKIEVNVFTEHNLKQPLLDNWLTQVQQQAPDCVILNNPWKGDFSKRFKTEIHNTHSKVPAGKFNFSYDGEDSTNSNIVAALNKFKNADLFCVWHPRLNLRYNEKDPANRTQRVKEANQRSPNKDMLLSLVYLFSDPGKIKLPKKWLIKSHAERHQYVDAKGDKLLIMAPIKADAIVLKQEGKQVAKLPYYGTFEGGLYRYYWNRYGYTAGKNLVPYIGNKSYGVLNGGFRAGGFR